MERKLEKQKTELTINNECLFLGNRIVIPESCVEKVLELLHSTHNGIVRMKSTARGSVWWYGIDRDIEAYGRSCDCCQEIEAKSSGIENQKWPPTTFPFERVHIDFFHYTGKQFLLLIDSYSKWLQVIEMKKTDAAKVISVLKTTFSAFGLPKELVSDNGPPFNSKAFREFCSKNGIKYTDPPTYHPQSNGCAERAVGITKRAIKKMHLDLKNLNLTLEQILQKFLFKYRNTSSTSTGKSRSELIFSYKPKTLLGSLSRKSGRTGLKKNNCLPNPMSRTETKKRKEK